jgi:hypothetical protein
MNNLDKNDDRPFAYPKPTETDVQLNNQPEYIDQQPNSMEKDISDVPASAVAGNSTSAAPNTGE